LLVVIGDEKRLGLGEGGGDDVKGLGVAVELLVLAVFGGVAASELLAPDATTAEDKKGLAARDRGTITSNDGWQAKRQTACAYDIGG
jgi:hypothetical protein